MTIVRAESMGYCMGVKRALYMVEKQCERYKTTSDGRAQKKIYTLGPLIHNEIALKKLQENGVSILESSDINSAIDSIDKENSVIVIRAHGVPPNVMKKLELSGVEVIDATCKKVVSSQKKAADFASRGFDVVIAGDKNHGEVVGIQGYAQQNANGGKVVVVENALQAEKLVLENSKCVVLSQTTFSSSEYEKIVEVMKKKFRGDGEVCDGAQEVCDVEVCGTKSCAGADGSAGGDFVVLNTICSATEERQCALHKLCLECDIVLVVGGKKSANTCRLKNLATEHCSEPAYKVKKVFHFEDLAEMKNDWPKIKSDFTDDSVVGITAGASTPEICIFQIEDFLLRE